MTRRAFKESTADNVSMLAAGVAFFAFLAIPPALIAALTLYALVADPQTVARQMQGPTRRDFADPLGSTGSAGLLLDPIRTRRRERRVLRSSTISVRRDEIDAREFARSCESTYRPVWWVCGSVGQMRPPLTVVGALVGGRAGQLSATVIARDFKSLSPPPRRM